MTKYRLPKIAQREPHPIPEGWAGILRMAFVAQGNEQKALVALCGMAGLRVSEACNVKHDDFDLEEMQLLVRGKGSKERIVPLGPEAWAFLKDGYEAVPGPVNLIGFNHDWARKLINHIGYRAGLSRQVSSHDLRATFATHLVAKKTHPSVIQRILGHANVTTTMVYMGVSEQQMREAVL
jgi:site-specific recombinase XerD